MQIEFTSLYRRSRCERSEIYAHANISMRLGPQIKKLVGTCLCVNAHFADAIGASEASISGETIDMNLASLAAAAIEEL